MRGQDAHFFLDTGAVPNLISSNLAKKLDLAITSMKKKMTVADRTMEICHRVAKKITVTFGELKEKMDFLVFDEVSVGVLIGIPEMEKLKTHIDLGGQYVSSTIGTKSIRVGLKHDWTIDQEKNDESGVEEFTTD